jgi:hypothetical protein
MRPSRGVLAPVAPPAPPPQCSPIPAVRFPGGSVLGDLFYHLGTAVGGLAPSVRQGRCRTCRPRCGSTTPAGVYDPETGAGWTWKHEAGTRPRRRAGGGRGRRLARGPGPPTRPVSWTRVVIAGSPPHSWPTWPPAPWTTVAADGGAERPHRPTRGDDPEAPPATLRRRHCRFRRLRVAPLSAPAGPAAPARSGVRRPGGGGFAAGAAWCAWPPKRPACGSPSRDWPSRMDDDAGPLSHLAFGLGLGLFYRADS